MLKLKQYMDDNAIIRISILKSTNWSLNLLSKLKAYDCLDTKLDTDSNISFAKINHFAMKYFPLF